MRRHSDPARNATAARGGHLVAAAACVALLGWSVVGLVTRDDAATRGPSEPGEIVISDFAFLPGTQAVAVGAVLTWSNSDSAAHTVDTNDQQLDSGSIARGETFEHTFATPGTFEYFCAFHPFMKGVVEVTR